MKCPWCVEQGERSRVYEGAQISTAMAVSSYWDEFGVYVRDDPNRHTTEYRCSRGHEWTVAEQEGETTVTLKRVPS